MSDYTLGRPRKPPSEKKVTIFVRLTQEILDKIEEEGNPSEIVAKIITQLYSKK